jgi:bifunctional polynucleotide phosphatase/kinase
LFEARFGEWTKSKEEHRIAGFDMDYTLIKTKSGALFPKNAADWQFLYDTEIQSKLKSLHAEDVRVIIFTNQGGVESGNTTLKELESKFSAI